MFQRGNLLVFFDESGQEYAESALADARAELNLSADRLLILEWVNPNLAVVDIIAGYEEPMLRKLDRLDGIRSVLLNYLHHIQENDDS